MSGATEQGDAIGEELRQAAPGATRSIWLQARSHQLWRRAAAAAPHLIAARGPRLRDRVGPAEVRRRRDEILDALQSGRLTGLSGSDAEALRMLIGAFAAPSGPARRPVRSVGNPDAVEAWGQAEQEWYQRLRAGGLQVKVAWFRLPSKGEVQQHWDRVIAEIGPPPNLPVARDRPEGSQRLRTAGGEPPCALPAQAGSPGVQVRRKRALQELQRRRRS